jgi:hypothetical protein
MHDKDALESRTENLDMAQVRVGASQTAIAEFCRRHHIRRLALFGSILRDDFREDSDVDVLVEFESDHVPGLISLAGIELKLSELLGGRKADMNTPLLLSRYIRDQVLSEAMVVYAEG